MKEKNVKTSTRSVLSDKKRTVRRATQRTMSRSSTRSCAQKRITRTRQQQVKTIEQRENIQALTTEPRFIRYDLTGPDGKIRKGWEMWIGKRCFGRADDKQLLLTSLARIQNPPRSHHWREKQFSGHSSQR